MYLCVRGQVFVLGVSILTLSTIFILDLGNAPTVVFFVLSFYSINISSVQNITTETYSTIIGNIDFYSMNIFEYQIIILNVFESAIYIL
jgi:hypothetical protein